MKRTYLGPNLKKTFLAVPAAALMLGVSQAQTTIGINFSGGAYASYASTYGASCYSGYPVTATAFGVTPANWYSSTNGTSVGIPYNYAAAGTMVVGSASSVTVNWTSADCWGTHIGFAQATTNSAGYLAPPAGNDEVTWGFLDNGGWTVSLSGLNSAFPNGYVIQCIAASGDTGTKVSSNSRVTDNATFTNSFSITPVDNGFGSVGLLAQTPTSTSDSISLASPSGSTACGLSGFIVTDKPVVTMDPSSTTNNQDSPVVLSCNAIGINPLSYQWRVGGVPIPGATYSSYTNASIQPTDAGEYDVVVTNLYGSATSGVANVGVRQAPVLSTDLSSATNIAYSGFNTTLSVVAGGAQPFSYQWSANTTAIPAATNASLIVSNSAAGVTGYSVLVTNIYGSVNSQTNYIDVVAAPDTYTVKVGMDAPTSYWPLNETSGTNAIDYSGNGHNGMQTNSSAFVLGVPGPQPPTLPGFVTGNTAYQFDGLSTYVVCGTNCDISGTNAFTVEAWVKTTAGTSGEIVCQRDGSNGGYIGAYRCYMNANGTLNFFVYGSGGQQFNFSSTKTVNDGNWHLVDFVRSGTTGTIYVDAANAGSGSGTDEPLNPAIQTYIGSNPRDNNNYFSGDIASVAIYNYALPMGHIINHYVTASGTPLTVTMIPGGIVQDSKPVGTPHPGQNFKTVWLPTSTDFNSVTRTGVQQFIATNNSQIVLPDNSDFDTTNGTISFWMNYAMPATLPSSGNEGIMLVDHRTTGGMVIVINKTVGNIEIQNTGGVNFTNQDFNAYVVDGNWHQVVVTYGQTTNQSDAVTLYVDGNQYSVVTNSRAWSWPTNQEIELGRSHDSYWYIYDGQMDEFRIYNRILSSSEVSSLYTDAIVDTNALKVRFNFDSDSSLNGHSLVWPYGSLQSSPALGSQAVWTTLTNAVSPQPLPIDPSVPAAFYRASFTP